MKFRHFLKEMAAFNHESLLEAKASPEVLEGKLLHIMDRNGRWSMIIEPDDRPDWRIPFVSAKGLPPVSHDVMLAGRYRMHGKSKKDKTFVISQIEYLGDKQPPDTVEGIADEKNVIVPSDASFTRCTPTIWKPEIDFEVGIRYRVKGWRVTKFLMKVFDYEKIDAPAKESQ